MVAEKGSNAPGLFSSTKPSRLSLLNGSHTSNSTAEGIESVLVFPDYKLVHVPNSLLGAKEFWDDYLHPSSKERGGKLPVWLLPYECVVLLCSHKRRDNRCGIASTVLSRAFQVTFEKHDWEVYTDLEDLEDFGTPLTGGVASTEQRQEILGRSKKRVLVLTNSHMGGHKFAGNVIIYTAAGAGVWYGRVTSHNVEPIIQETVISGKVLPELLRGGINLSCRQGTILDW